MISNLLDNAVEEVMLLDENDREIKLFLNKERLSIQNKVSSSFDESMMDYFPVLKFSTKGNDRGFGLPNVEAIVIKAGYVLKIFFTGEYFNIEIIMDPRNKE